MRGRGIADHAGRADHDGVERMRQALVEHAQRDRRRPRGSQRLKTEAVRHSPIERRALGAAPAHQS